MARSMATEKSAWQRSANEISEGMRSRFSPAVFVGYITLCDGDGESVFAKGGAERNSRHMVHGCTAVVTPGSSMSRDSGNSQEEGGGVKSALVYHLHTSEHSRIDTWESSVLTAVTRIANARVVQCKQDPPNEDFEHGLL
jgi:hypothetical protein